jgi:predicted phosphatase
MTEKTNQAVEAVSEPSKRGRKKNCAGENAPELFRRLFQLWKQIESKHTLQIDRQEILNIADEENVLREVVEIILNVVELRFSIIEKQRIITQIREKIS